MAVYANKTEVSPEKTRTEIERTLQRYGAKEFAFMMAEQEAKIAFKTESRQVLFVLPLVPPQKLTEKNRQQFIRSRWRALLLAIKAKLEAVSSGISTFEQEFMAFIVNPATGRTVAEELTPLIEEAYNNPRSGEPLRLTGPV
jgi:hypothetical protein